MHKNRIKSTFPVNPQYDEEFQKNAVELGSKTNKSSAQLSQELGI
ncbi:hypothetical protein LEP1GSC047_2098 [Leptospira inadai serovar Lyme str. 10]|uniref:Uncharacterized protein n=2 Tax=Leptospira inadai serovar Lyme TaxID=293084 RepID=V6HFI5_9LEPT|nr:hypothetical protein LEP1GSC047_2098 [Leptospira inadai serovar Lyme str. 10]